MNIADMKIRDYLDVLKTDAPAPGGGSVSGVTAAQGIALTLMVVELTVGKEKYKEYEELNLQVREEAMKLYYQLLEAADNDKKAFTKLSEAYKLPKNTEEEKVQRKETIGKLSLDATKAPFDVMKNAFEALEVTEKIVGKSNRMASSDLGVAAANLLAASKSAWLNVKINLPYLNDAKEEKYFREEGMKLLKETELLANKIYEAVEGEL